MYPYAVIRADINSSDLGAILSQHRTAAAAERALAKLGNVRGVYVAHRKADGDWARRLEARDRREAPPAR